MSEKMDKIKKLIEEIKTEHKLQYDENNRMIINMEINNDDNLLNEFSKNEYPVIGSSFADYIEKVTTSINPREKFVLRIHSNCVNEQEKVIYTKAIRNYYIDKYIVECRNLRRNWIIAIILGIIGLLVLITSIFLEYQENSILWMRVFDIVAWVFIWESVDILVFQCNQLKMSRLRYLNLIEMEIEYV